MNKIKLETEEQFKELKKGDCLWVNWNKEGEVWDKSMRGSVLYKILATKKGSTRSPYPDEIILRKKGNIFFNFRLFLNGESKIVKDVYLCTDFQKVGFG